jgi:phage-related protein
MKDVVFHGDALEKLKDFPEDARRECGYALHLVQLGIDPPDWKPMPGIGSGVREIRVLDATGAYRVIYVAKFSDAIHVLHIFQKKTRKTSPGDMELASRRLRTLLARRQ